MEYKTHDLIFALNIFRICFEEQENHRNVTMYVPVANTK